MILTTFIMSKFLIMKMHFISNITLKLHFYIDNKTY